MALESELKKTISLTKVDPAKDNYQATTNGVKLNIETVIESWALTTAVHKYEYVVAGEC